MFSDSAFYVLAPEGLLIIFFYSFQQWLYLENLTGMLFFSIVNFQDDVQDGAITGWGITWFLL